jgi:hypothetical protein
MKTIKFENLIDIKTGKTVEIEVPDDLEISGLPGRRAKGFANRVRQVKDFNEVAELGREAGKKLREVFSK